MSAQRLKFLAPPVFENDPEKTFAASLLNTILLSMLFGAVLYGVGTPITPTLLPLRFAYVGTFVLLVLSLLYLMRQGRVKLASWAIVAGTWIILTLASITSGGVLAPGYSGYVIPILCAGLLLGIREGIGWAIASILSGAAMFYASTSGLLPEPVVLHDSASTWLAQSVYFIVATVLLGMALRSINKTLGRTQLEVEDRRESEQRYKTMLATTERLARELTLLDKVRSALASQLDLQTLIQVVVESIVETFGYTLVSLYLLEGDKLVLQHEIGYDHVITEIPIEKGIMGYAVRAKKPILVEDVRSEPKFIGAIEDIVSEVCVPLFDEEQVVGALNVESTQNIKLSEADLELMVALGEHVSVAIRRARLFTQVQKNREQFQSLFENVPVGIGVVDRTGRFLAFNEAVLSPGGYTAQDIQELGSVEKLYYDPEDRTKVLSILQQEGRVTKYPVQFIRKDGSPYDTLLTLRLTEFDGQPAIQALVEDVSEQKKAEDALKQSEERYRTLVEQAADGIFISDMDGNYKDVNPSGCIMLGYSREEILKLNIRNLLDPTEIKTSPLTKRDIKEGKTSITERRLRKKNGTYFSAEISSKLLPDGRLLEIIRDITERIRAEQVRLEEQKRFRSMIENSMDGMALYSAEANVLYQAPAIERLLGYTPEEVQGSNVAEFIHPDDVEQIGEAYRRIMESPSEPIIAEARVRHKNGSYRWLEVIITNKLSEPGIQALVANYRDITERKESEERLRASEDQYRQLVEHSPYAIAVHSQGKLVYLNQAGVKLIGSKDAESLYGSQIIEYVHPDSRPKVIQRLKELGEGKDAPPLIEKFIRQNGSPVQVEVTAYPLAYQGKPAVQVVIRDLTQQLQAEQTIRESQERFSKAFHASPIPICITTLDEGRFLDVNESYLTLSGWKREEVVGRTTADLKLYQDGGRTDFVRRLLNSEIPQGHPDKFITATGEVYEVATFYELIELGGQPCILSMFYNMTEQNRSRELLRSSEERLRAIVDHTQNIYYSRTPDYTLTYISAQVKDILGYKPEEALIKWQNLLTDHPVNQRGAELAQKAITTGQPQEPYILELKSKDKTPVWVEVRETPVVRDGQTVAIVGALTDIRDRKEAEKKIERNLAELTVLHAVAMAGSQSDTEDEVIERVTQIVNGMLYPDNCGALLLSQDGKGLRPHPSYRGASPESMAAEYPLTVGISGRVAISGKLVRIDDVSKETDYIKTTDGIRSELCVPILVNEKIIGVFNAESRKQNGFDEEDERVLITIAGALGTAIERIRLFNAEQKRRKQAEILREATAVLTTTIELERLFEIILDTLPNLVPFTSASIEIIEGDMAKIAAERGLPKNGKFKGRAYSFHPEKWGKNNHRPIIIADAQTDPRFEKWDGAEYIRGWMGIPMFAQDKQIAFLNLDSDKVNFFTEEQAALVQTFANQAAIAIKNADLYRSEKLRYQEAEKLRQAATVVASSLNLKEVLDILLNALKDVVPYDSASILLTEGDRVRIVAGHGFPDPKNTIDKLYPLSNKLLQAILGSGQPLILEDAQRDIRFEKWAAADKVRGWMGVPMIARGQVIGFITLDSLLPSAYNPSTAVLAQSFAHQAAVAIENAELFENLQKSNVELSNAYDTTLEGWGKALELRDKETQGHTERVAELTLRLARKMELGKEELVQIRRGVLVHDIGKMGISDRILNKKGPLTQKEWEEMHKHPQYAFDMLYPITYLRPALDVAFCHHERWDGSGYPRGLKGDQIPLSARIFAVVDVWDALLYDRPYRKAWTKKRAMKYIRDHSGTHFDPAVVQVFLKMIAEK